MTELRTIQGFNVQCKKCGKALSVEEFAATAKEDGAKCVGCAVKGYKFVMGLMHREIEELKAKLEGREPETKAMQIVAKPADLKAPWGGHFEKPDKQDDGALEEIVLE